MRSPTEPSPSIPELMELLRLAVERGDGPKARLLEQAILQRLALEAKALEDAERAVRELMAKLPGEPLTAKEPPFGIVAEGRGLSKIGSPAGLRTQGGVQKAALPPSVLTSVEPAPSPPAPSAQAAEGVIYPVWFGTNRKPLPEGGFGGERHDQVTHGRVDVQIPEAHRFGETGNGFWRRLCRFDLRDDNLRIQKLETLSLEAALSEIQKAAAVAKENGEVPHALLFLHGYKTTFEEAAIRAAQIGVDLKVPGATAFFSWPSRGTVTAYTADEASIEASEAAISKFLVDFTSQCGAERVHIIAHSMGNRGLLRALQRIAANAESRDKLKVSQIFLAAPDVDRDLFLDLAKVYSEFNAERTTLYASDADLPVHLSSKVHAAPRAGYFMPYTIAQGVDTIAVPDFDVDLLGHSFFANAEALLYDIGNLMRRDEHPRHRQRVEQSQYEDQAFWRLRR